MINASGLFWVTLQRINIQRRVRLHIGYIEDDGATQYHRITRARLKGWPPSVSKTTVLTDPLVKPRRGDILVVTVGAPDGRIRSARNGYFRNSIMAGRLKVS